MNLGSKGVIRPLRVAKGGTETGIGNEDDGANAGGLYLFPSKRSGRNQKCRMGGRKVAYNFT